MAGNTVAIVFGIGAAALLIGLLVCFFQVKRKNHKTGEATKTVSEPVCEPIMKTATAVDKQVFMRQTGTVKAPAHRLEFEVRFVCESGETLVLPVEAEAYARIPKNSAGTLVLVNGAFLDFQVCEPPDA